MRLVFCGTPEFAVSSLAAVLEAGHEVPLVLTQPDRPAGRQLALQASPVKRLALERGLPVLQPERIRHNEALETHLRALQPEVIVVVAYGRIIPPWMLSLPRLGNINVHGSLLPRYRGAAPIQWAVANGETETGVTTMLLDAGMDTGGILLEHRVPISPDTMASELFSRLAATGAALLVETLAGLSEGQLTATPQDHAAATYAPILRREDGLLLLPERTAQQAYDRWRGFYPWPGAFASLRGKRFLVHAMRPAQRASTAGPLAPNELHVDEDGLWVGAASQTTLRLDEVQLEGKPRMSGPAFAKGFQLRPGEHLA